MNQRVKRKAARVLHYINRIEDWLLILMLSAMVILAVAQILFRNVFDSGIVWADPLLRTLVLWVALSGAVIATRTNNHIRIDILSRYLICSARCIPSVFLSVY
jgi:TRAP-type C4-dicarboxylate transport system permease small subunit